MNKTFASVFALLFCLIGASSSVNAQEPVSLQSTDDGWAVMVDATGNATQEGTQLRINLDHLGLSFGQTTAEVVRVRSFKIGLAYGKPNGGWTVDRWSNSIDKPLALRAGERNLSESLSATISTEGLPSLESYWLVIAVEAVTGMQTIRCYAHNSAGRFARN